MLPLRTLACTLALSVAAAAAAQSPAPSSGQRYDRLLIRNVIGE